MRAETSSLTVSEKLSSIVRSVAVADGRETPRERERDRDQDRLDHDRADREHRERERERDRSERERPDRSRGRDKDTAQYDPYGNRVSTRSRQGSRTSSLTREILSGSRSETGDPALRYENGHWRNSSGVSGGDYAEHPPSVALAPTRRQDYDFHSMENEPSPRNSVSNPIPPPTLTVKSEFPSLIRSKTQQTLTCLVTLEVGEKKWQNYADDVAAVPSAYDQQYAPPSPTGRGQFPFDLPEGSSRAGEREAQQERAEQEHLAAITEDLRQRVENWHGLDFNRYCTQKFIPSRFSLMKKFRFGKLRLHGTIKVGKDCQAWQELECFLFSEMLICVKEKKVAVSPQWAHGPAKKKTVKCTLKGSILIKKHLRKVVDFGGTGMAPIRAFLFESPPLMTDAICRGSHPDAELVRGGATSVPSVIPQPNPTGAMAARPD